MQIVGYDSKFNKAFIEMNKAWIDQVIQHFEFIRSFASSPFTGTSSLL